ncbi:MULTISPECIES: DMT family transporter [Lysinibacillus]|jgi:multidrug transporter EmrE-like cation transporter|uniref:DMT family transporter n=1 Tax=Lysinibacillus TaxID=400634 RepID=UPI0004D719DB|nr:MULTISPECIES: multidrug efflux SMR transporter [Lysinibacillus]AJK88305.1 quaternary ammonium transporter [Lysinibacillus fusiformis]KAB0442439.1 QacE family quaternary ammonium compound efflux SMR transporter [Lysinibacillus fusiformis]KEK10674.1 quaternary ammonium transporter [Lysinibacillus sphaericus]KGA84216.1 quaternary ammonium transporter [Lysinibacillus fusiformis]KHK49972.1 quaternary ammonium transporter [Lysinibacillus sp. A1]
MKVFSLLFIAIVAEVFASSMLKRTEGFSRIWPSIGVVVGYGTAFYCLALTLKTIPIGTAYAIWAGLGTALTAIVGVVLYKEIFNRKKVLGILCIIVGVVVLNLAGGH